MISPFPLVSPLIKHVHIAKLHVASTGILKATLGSCVAISLIDTKTGLCAMAHCLLPVAPDGASPDDARYADRAIANLLKSVNATPGVKRRGLRAFLSGGSRMRPENNPGRPAVGELNVAAARASFAAHRIPFTELGIGGTEGCTVVLDCDEKVITCSPIHLISQPEEIPWT